MRWSQRWSHLLSCPDPVLYKSFFPFSISSHNCHDYSATIVTKIITISQFSLLKITAMIIMRSMMMMIRKKRRKINSTHILTSVTVHYKG